MDIVNDNLKKSLEILNINLKNKLYEIEGLDRKSLRSNLANYGKLINLRKLTIDEMKYFKPTACIDGSVNRYGGSHPHYIDLFQGLSKISGDNKKSHFKSNIFSPIINSIGDEDDEDLRNKLLAKIEVDVALDTLEMDDVKVILMDGNLIRYSIRISEEYEMLKEKCEERNIFLAGFIKEAKSDSIFSLLFPKITDFKLYDKDLLYGVLDVGEGFIPHDDFNKKIDQGISSMILRTSNYPGVGGLEILSSQRDYLINIANFCYSLTPIMSRGVPMLIDMVDKEVKLDDKLTTELINSYVDRDVLERFFVSERSLRRY